MKFQKKHCCGSGSRKAKMTQKNIKQLINFIFWNSGCSLLGAEVFFCSLDVLCERLGIGKFQFFYQKIGKLEILAVFFSSIFFAETLDPDPPDWLKKSCISRHPTILFPKDGSTWLIHTYCRLHKIKERTVITHYWYSTGTIDRHIPVPVPYTRSTEGNHLLAVWTVFGIRKNFIGIRSRGSVI